MPPQISAARPGARGTPTGSNSGFRGTGAFKPPRPVAGGAARTAGATSASKTSRSRPAVDVEISDDDNGNGNERERGQEEEDDDVDELERSRISSANRRRRTIDQFQEEAEPEEGAATDVPTDNDDNDDDDDPATRASKTLPPALLTRLLHHFFQNPGGTPTRMTQDAHASVNKYMEIFIREAVARSVAERGNGAFLDVGSLGTRTITVRLLAVY